MRRALYPLTIVVMSAALTAGCGAGDAETSDRGTATFDRPEFDVTFDYPASFMELDDVSFNQQAGNAAAATAGVGLDGSNIIAIQRFDQDVAVTDKNLKEVQPQADMLFSQLAGEDLKGKEVEVGGLPALEYEIDLMEPPEGRTRAVAVFDGETQYLVNCQSTPEQREAIEAACDRALETLETR